MESTKKWVQVQKASLFINGSMEGSKMSVWSNHFLKDTIFFINPDIGRAILFDGLLPHYHIICASNDAIIPILRNQGNSIFSLEEVLGSSYKPLDNSAKLLEQPKVLQYIQENSSSTPYIFYFKPSLKIDTIIEKYGFQRIGNTLPLNELFENKIESYACIKKYFPNISIAGETGVLGKLNFQHLIKLYGLPVVIQFSHGWAGKTTYFVKTEEEFNRLQSKFSETHVKVTHNIKGYTLLNNCCIYQNEVFVSPPAIQISGIDRLSTNPAVTCGRQWPVDFLSQKQINTIEQLSKQIGFYMKNQGFRGFFGLDFLLDEATGVLYFSEINARLTASSSFFTRLQIGMDTIPLTVLHMATFLKKSLPDQYRQSTGVTGSQVNLRNKSLLEKFGNIGFGVFSAVDNGLVPEEKHYYPEKLEKNQFIFIARYRENKVKESELGRIETKQKILQTPNSLQRWLKAII